MRYKIEIILEPMHTLTPIVYADEKKLQEEAFSFDPNSCLRTFYVEDMNEEQVIYLAQILKDFDHNVIVTDQHNKLITNDYMLDMF